MLISYPVLPAAAPHDNEDVYLNNVLAAHLLPNEGIYPVSTITTVQGALHRWHGGIHLQGAGEPIRAIADGTLVAFRFAAARKTYGALGEYDTSFVLLKHDTFTGEHTQAVFYSLYMHLASKSDLQSDRFQQLPGWLRQAAAGPAVQTPAGQKVWRKDVLGFAGQLYGHEAVHFEVFMLDADFNQIWRDSTAVTQGTGSDDWFGDTHFVIPANQTFAARHPRAATTGVHRIDFAGADDFALPVGQGGSNADKLFVSVELTQGRRIATTYRQDPDGNHVQVGQSVVQDGYEYELYRLATTLYPDCPSTGMQWLRNGRIEGPDANPRNENWQLIRYSEDAIGYIDLAPAGIAKLSDADFPHWHGWQKRDEGATANASDGICDDEATLALIRAPSDTHTAQLRHFICKAPSEWDDSDLATRYARLREPGQELESEAKWAAFTDHVSKLAFWGAAGLSERSVWHFHPLQFVRHFRKCGWLTAAEFKQMLPSHAIRAGTPAYWEPVQTPAVVTNLISRYLLPLNRMMRRYGVDTGTRKAAFFGNALQETTWLSTLSEGGGSGSWYAPWYGRGFLQLTNPDNYCTYWTWRGRAVPATLKTALVAAYNQIYAVHPASARSNAALRDVHFPALTLQMKAWRSQVDNSTAPPKTPEDEFSPADSAGFYWVKNRMASYADQVHVLERLQVNTGSGAKVYYRSPAFWRASAAVNLPGAINSTYHGINGFDSRCSAYGVITAVVGDVKFPNAQGALTLSYPEGYTPRRT
jgi:predicted chitinase